MSEPAPSYYLKSVPPTCKLDGRLTRTVDSKPIAAEGKYLAASSFDGGFREVLLLANMLDEFHSNLLYQLKRGFPVEWVLADNLL